MSGATPEQLREMATAYVLGTLSDADARAFAAWLESSPEAQREVAELRELLPVLASAIDGPKPPASLRNRVIAHATRKAAAPAPAAPVKPIRTPRPVPVAWIAMAASVIALIGVSISHVRLQTALNARDSVAAELRHELTHSQVELGNAEEILRQLVDPSTSLTRLTAQGNAAPEIRFFYNRAKGTAVASAAGLTPNAAGRVYQLWLIPKGGAPIPSVTFTVDAEGKALIPNIQVPANQNLAVAAVTDEPTGGSPQPTTTPFLVGNL